MLFAKRDMINQGEKTLSQRFTKRFTRYLGNHSSNDASNGTQLIDIRECYELLGEGDAIEQQEPSELPHIIHRIVTAYEKQTNQWLEPEQVALAVIHYDIRKQAKILRKHFTQPLNENSELFCSSDNISYLHLALLANALGIQHFSSSKAATSPATTPVCQRKLNMLLDDISMPEIEASGRKLREHCTQSLIAKGINPDALQACWHLRMRYTNSDSSLLMKCMPIDMMRDVFETQHKQQFGFIAQDESILIDSLEIEVKLNEPCKPGMPADNHYVQQIMAEWTACSCQTDKSWRRLEAGQTNNNLSFLKCPVLKKILANHIAKPTDLAMSNFFVRNFKKEVDEAVMDN